MNSAMTTGQTTKMAPGMAPPRMRSAIFIALASASDAPSINRPPSVTAPPPTNPLAERLVAPRRNKICDNQPQLRTTAMPTAQGMAEIQPAVP